MSSTSIRLTIELEGVLCAQSRRRAEPGSGDDIAAEAARLSEET